MCMYMYNALEKTYLGLLTGTTLIDDNRILANHFNAPSHLSDSHFGNEIIVLFCNKFCMITFNSCKLNKYEQDRCRSE